MPLRRVNAAFVIGTSTVVPGVADVKLPAALAAAADKKSEAAFFKEAKAPLAKGKKGWEESQTAAEEKKKVLPEAKKAAQTAADAGVKLSAELTAYLKAKFSLSKGEKPHEMKF